MAKTIGFVNFWTKIWTDQSLDMKKRGAREWLMSAIWPTYHYKTHLDIIPYTEL